MPFDVTCKDCLFNVNRSCRVAAIHPVGANTIVHDEVRGGTMPSKGAQTPVFGWAPVPVDEAGGCSHWAPQSVDYRAVRENDWNRKDPNEQLLAMLDKVVATNPGAKIVELLEAIRNESKKS